MLGSIYNIMLNFFKEIYQYLFISSFIYIIYIVLILCFKIFEKFKLNVDSKFIISDNEKILLWISIAIFFTYLI